MTDTILRNPYAAILRAIWSIIIEISQGTGNTLAYRLRPFLPLIQNRHYEYNTNGGAGNPLLWLLYPEDWGCSVSKRKPPKTAKEQIYWQAIRLLVLRRDDNQCQNCGALSNLCVHHLSYTHQGNELEHLEDLTTLCRSCHARVHEGWKPNKSKLLPRYKFNPDGRWMIQHHTWGQYGNLESCINALFEFPSHITTNVRRRQIEDRCLEIGYVSINGWSICYITDEGESTLDTEVD